MSSSQPSPLITTGTAARLVNRDDRALRTAIAAQRLSAINDNGRWLVRLDDVLAWDMRAPRYTTTRRQAPTWDRCASQLAEYGSASAEEMAALLGIHVGNARKYLAILAKQGRARRLPDAQWVLVAPAETKGAA